MQLLSGRGEGASGGGGGGAATRHAPPRDDYSESPLAPHSSEHHGSMGGDEIPF
jgi:hypothetical protein